MATSDRGLIDVERFDLEPQRPILHGLLGDTDIAGLSGLSNREKIAHVLRIIDATSLSARGAASLVELGQTLSTWPQLAGDVALGAAVAEAIRRIGLRETLPSGRVRIDIATALDQLDDPATSRGDRRSAGEYTDPAEPAERSEIADIIAAAAFRAPSGGNAQPWHIETREDSVILRLAPEHKSTIDVGFRGSAVAIGAAVQRPGGRGCPRASRAVQFGEHDDPSPLHAIIRLTPGDDPDLARLYRMMLVKETNRHHGTPAPVPAAIIGLLLEAAARREGARLQLLTARDEIDKAATILATSDRIRYLSPRLHADMESELRWPGDGSPELGIDVRSLELNPGDLLTLTFSAGPR